ncbi:MAG: sulfur carrier protein ThiS [Desulfocapsaceae bacterium]|nr:sulfur carrier protein ThiS [Desulfocapsaceae bacterium]
MTVNRLRFFFSNNHCIMQIHLNGSPKTITNSMTVAMLLQELGVPSTSVVVELNKTIIQPDSYATTSLQDNDQMELIRFVGGG